MKTWTIKIIIISTIWISLISWGSYTQAEVLTYHIQIDQSNPYQAKVVVDTSSLNNFTLLPARSLKQNAKTAPLVICDKQKKIKADKALALVCNQISWEINFKALGAENENLAQQDNLFITQPQPWWILNEWDNLPRFKGQDQALVCMKDDGNPPRCKPLPTEQQPPLIMAFGSQLGVYQLGQLEVHLFGVIDAQAGEVLLKKYDQIINYLASVIPNNIKAQQWDLIWLPLEKSSGSLGGAAGLNSFMANYPVENGQWTDQSEEWLLRISAHEAVHVITRLNNPAWAEESLAEYYAFKALDKFGLASDNPLSDFRKTKAKIPHSDSGLYYAEKQVTRDDNQKDMSFYPLFYRKGAAFWYEVDMALQNQGGNLDDYIKLLDGLTFFEGQLPEKFEAALQVGMSLPVWEKIKQTYLLN